MRSKMIYEMMREVGVAPPPTEGPEAGSALELLQSVYRDPAQPQSVRIKTAGMAIAYETPKLSISSRVDHRGMGNMLERAALQAKRLAEPEPGAPVDLAAGGASFRRVVPNHAEAIIREAVLDPVGPRRKPG